MYRYIYTAITAFVFCSSAGYSYGLVHGTIRDIGGTPISGAEITLIGSSPSGQTFIAFSDSAGQFEIEIAAVHIRDEAPVLFRLDQNYPNPFNPSTTIPFTLARAGRLTLNIYSILGRHVRTLADGYFESGPHALVWDGTGSDGERVSAGIYFFQLKNDETVVSRKMVLLDGGPGRGKSSGPEAISRDAHVSVSRPARPEESTMFSLTAAGAGYYEYRRENLQIASDMTLNITLASLAPGVRNGIPFVSIPGGTFQMGEESNALPSSSRPVHTVTLTSACEMSAGEITNAQFASFLREALVLDEISATSDLVRGKGQSLKYSDMAFLNLAGYDGEPENRCRIHYKDGDFSVEPGYENRPVIWVTWYGARRFAMHYGFDLPTEAEWEYACRGGDQNQYGTDSGFISQRNANYWNSRILHPVDVGSYEPNPFGLHDMSGNVWEWCHDLYDETYYTVSPELDPRGPAYAPSHTIRGGCFDDDEYTCRAGSRSFANASVNTPLFGFRVVYRPGGVVY